MIAALLRAVSYVIRVIVMDAKITRELLFAPSDVNRLCNVVTFLGLCDFSNRQDFLSKGFKACVCTWASAHQSILILSLNCNTAFTDLDLVIGEISSGTRSDSADGREMERLTSGWDFSCCSSQDAAACTAGGFVPSSEFTVNL